MTEEAPPAPAEAAPIDATPTPPTTPDAVPDAPVWESFSDVALKDWAAAEKLTSAEQIAERAREFDLIANTPPEDLTLLPNAEDPNAVNAFLRERMSVPEDAADYKLDRFAHVDPEAAADAGQWFKEAAVSNWQADVIARAQIDFMQAQQKELANEDASLAQLEDKTLRDEWGDKYDAQKLTSRRVMGTLLRDAGVSDPAGALAFLEGGEGMAAVLKFANLFASRFSDGELMLEADLTPLGKTKKAPANDMASRWYPQRVGE